MGQSQNQAQAPAKKEVAKALPNPQQAPQFPSGGLGIPAYAHMMADPLHAMPVGKPDFNAVGPVVLGIDYCNY